MSTEPRPTWAPIGLSAFVDGTHQPITPTMLTRTDGVSLIYPGLTHSLHGESESGKSLVAQAECARMIEAGRPVLYVDFESDEEQVAERLLMLGASPAAILTHFHYLRPEMRPTAPQEMGAWAGLLGQRFDLAVIDGVTDALGVFGFSTTDNDEITLWARMLPKAIAQHTGAGVVMVDHVTKDSDSRGRFAIGGQAKLAGLTGAAYTVEVEEPLGRGLRGVTVLRVAKDRPGYVRGLSGPMRKGDRTQEAARVVVDSTGPSLLVTVEPWKGSGGTHTDAGPFRPTAIMQNVSEVLEAAPAPISFRTLDDTAVGKQEYIRAAVQLLEAEGYVATSPGPRNATMHRSLRPYRQVEDPLSDTYEQGYSHRPPTTVSVSRPKDGGRDTDTQPYPGDSGDTVGIRSPEIAFPTRLAVVETTCSRDDCNGGLKDAAQLSEGHCWKHLSGVGRQRSLDDRRAAAGVQ